MNAASTVTVVRVLQEGGYAADAVHIIASGSDYGERLSAIAEDVKGDGLKNYDEQQVELNTFEYVLKEARQKGQQKAIDVIRNYKEKESEVFNHLRAKLEDYAANDDDDEYIELKDSDFKTLKEANVVCKKELLRIESDLTEQCDIILNEFEARYGKLRAKSAEIMEKYFPKGKCDFPKGKS